MTLIEYVSNYRTEVPTPRAVHGVVQSAMDEYPLLNPEGLTGFYGYYTRSGWHGRFPDDSDRARYLQERRADMFDPRYVGQFVRAYAYLAQMPRTKHINQIASSYGLKHEAESHWYAWLEAQGHHHNHTGYVANGMLIAAAHALGFTIKAIGINARFNISRRRPVSPRYYTGGEMMDFGGYLPLLRSVEAARTEEIVA